MAAKNVPPKPEPVPMRAPAKKDGAGGAAANGGARVANGGAPGGGAAAPAVRRDANYEPLPNELQNVKLYKPEVDSKLGLVLFTPCEDRGDTRPRIKSMREGAIAADSGVLEIDDIILKVNGQPAKGHTETTKMLKEAKGNITITMFRLKIEETPPAPPPEEAAPPVAGVMSFGAPSGGSWGDEVDAPPPPKPKAWGGQPTLFRTETMKRATKLNNMPA